MKKKTKNLTLMLLAISTVTIGAGYLDTLKVSDVHETLNSSDCLSCHAEQSNYNGKSKINASKLHDEVFRKYDHGSHAYTDLFTCTSCHTQKECIDCHSQKPESHTNNFIKPVGDGIQKHAFLSSMNTDSCVACHKPTIQQDCGSCHTVREVDSWIEMYGSKLNWSTAR